MKTYFRFGFALAGVLGVVCSSLAAPENVFVLDEGWNKTGLYSHWTQYNNQIYNLYTPGGNSYAGCTAVAGAAVLQFLNVSPGPEGVTKTCSFNGSETNLTTKGGDYNWSDFKGSDVRARVLYDVGVCSKMKYRNTANSASVANLYDLAPALVEHFDFTSAEYIVGPVHENLIYNQLRCGMPVILDVYGTGNTGHTVTAVGYGETADGAPRAYVFMGAAGSGDGWCNLPNVSSFTWMLGGVSGFAYNDKDDKSVALVGKVFNEDGKPIKDAQVKISITNGAEVETLTTGEFGQYATRVSSLNSSYTLSVDGYTDRVVSCAYTKFPDKIDFCPGEEVSEPLTVYTSAQEAYDRAISDGKFIFGMRGRDGLGWVHYVFDAIEELGASFTDNYIFYYEVYDAVNYNDAVTCKVFNTTKFKVEDGMNSSDALAEITGLNYNARNIESKKIDIQNSLMSQLPDAIVPTKWVWVGASGTADAPEDWTNTANWQWQNANGAVASTRPASGDYPSKLDVTNAWMPIEINGTESNPIYVKAPSEKQVEGYKFRLTLSHANVVIENLGRMYGDPTYVHLTDQSSLTISDFKKANYQWTIQDLNIGDGCTFKVSENVANATVNQLKINLNKTGRFEFVSWTKTGTLNVEVSCDLDLEAAQTSVVKKVKLRQLGEWTGSGDNNLNITPGTVIGAVGDENNDLNLESDVSNLPIGTYNFEKTSNQYVVYYVDYDASTETPGEGNPPEETFTILATFKDFSKTSDAGNYTATVNEEVVTTSSVVIDDKPLILTSANEGWASAEGLTVLVKYKDLPTGNTVKMIAATAATGGTYDVYGISANNTSNNRPRMYEGDSRFWTNGNTSIPSSGYLIWTYQQSKEGHSAKLYTSDGTELFGRSDMFVDEELTIGKTISIGGTPSNGSVATGLEIEGVRIYRGVIDADAISVSVKDFDPYYEPIVPGVTTVFPTLDVETAEEATNEVAKITVKWSEQDKATYKDDESGDSLLTDDMLMVVPVDDGAGGFKAQIVLNPEKVDAPDIGVSESGGESSGEMDAKEPIEFTEEEGQQKVTIHVKNAVPGLWYGYLVGAALNELTQDTTTPFARATTGGVNMNAIPRPKDEQGNYLPSAFFKVIVLPYNPNPVTQ